MIGRVKGKNRKILFVKQGKYLKYNLPVNYSRFDADTYTVNNKIILVYKHFCETSKMSHSLCFSSIN